MSPGRETSPHSHPSCRIIAMMSPEDSWVSKWQRISNFKPGVYAVSVTGRLPQGIVRELKSRGVAYKSRDTAIKT
nr:PREDICTED: transcription elongation factor SPT4 [Haliaeetus albicilla]